MKDVIPRVNTVARPPTVPCRRTRPPIFAAAQQRTLEPGNSGLRRRLIGYSLFAQYLLYGRDE